MMPEISDDLLRAHDVLVSSDNPFQRRARLLQALWRIEQGLPAGERRPGVPLGSRIAHTHAVSTRVNLMTPAARDAAVRALDAMHAGSGARIDEDRLWANLLSSQPLAFNLFAELRVDLDLASRVFRRLWPGRVDVVSLVDFEYSPGRGSMLYTADRTAFDVYVEHTTPDGGRGFLGIEVKYHEALGEPPARHRPRYESLARQMRCFRTEALPALRRAPLEQIWRDHMLAGSIRLASSSWTSAVFVMLYPEDNAACASAVQQYRAALADETTFDARTLEQIVDAISAETDAPWVDAVRSRYLGWERLGQGARSASH